MEKQNNVRQVSWQSIGMLTEGTHKEEVFDNVEFGEQEGTMLYCKYAPSGKGGKQQFQICYKFED